MDAFPFTVDCHGVLSLQQEHVPFSQKTVYSLVDIQQHQEELLAFSPVLRPSPFLHGVDASLDHLDSSLPPKSSKERNYYNEYFHPLGSLASQRYLRPNEYHKAYEKMLEAITLQQQLQTSVLSKKLFTTGFRAFYSFPITKKQLPTKEWLRWNQSNATKKVTKQQTTVTITKYYSRLTFAETRRPQPRLNPGYKLWIIQIHRHWIEQNGSVLFQSHMKSFVWCEVGKSKIQITKEDIEEWLQNCQNEPFIETPIDLSEIM